MAHSRDFTLIWQTCEFWINSTFTFKCIAYRGSSFQIYLRSPGLSLSGSNYFVTPKIEHFIKNRLEPHSWRARSNWQQLPFASLLPLARLLYFNVEALRLARCYHSQPCYHSTSFEGLASSSYLFSVRSVTFGKFFPFSCQSLILRTC